MQKSLGGSLVFVSRIYFDGGGKILTKILNILMNNIIKVFKENHFIDLSYDKLINYCII